jgi:polar amino acid transport system substrate-binding protein
MIKSTVVALMTTLGAAALFAGSSQAQDVPSFASKGKVTFCADATFPPMEFFEKTGDKTPTGFDVDLMQALAKEWKVEAEIVTMDFAGLLPSLEANRCDVIISGMFVTPARTEKFDAVPYLATASVLIAKEGVAPLSSLEELSGKTVAVQTGTEFVKWFDKLNGELKAQGKPEVNVQLYPKASDGIQQVLIGRSFTATTQDTEVAYRQLQNPGQLASIYTFEDVQKFGIYLRREGENKKAVEAALEALRANGEMQKLAEKWNFPAQMLNVAQ